MFNSAFWFVQIPGWLLFVYLVYAQCLPAFQYELGVRLGTQEPAENVTEVGAAFWWALAFADLIVYTPLLGLGLVGHALESEWSFLVLGAALGITVYWPIVCLATICAARNATNWNLPKERQYWIVLPIISLWGAFALYLLYL